MHISEAIHSISTRENLISLSMSPRTDQREKSILEKISSVVLRNVKEKFHCAKLFQWKKNNSKYPFVISDELSLNSS